MLLLLAESWATIKAVSGAPAGVRLTWYLLPGVGDSAVIGGGRPRLPHHGEGSSYTPQRHRRHQPMRWASPRWQWSQQPRLGQAAAAVLSTGNLLPVPGSICLSK